MRRRSVMCLALALLAVLAGCGGETAPAFPPTEETITAALESSGLTETLCPEETTTVGTQTIYALRDASEEDRLAMTWVHGTEGETGRTLTVEVFRPSAPESPDFSWEDWKGYLTLAAELYGFEEPEALYQALSQKTMEEGAVPVGPEEPVTQRAVWETELPEGFCVVVYRLANTRIEEPISGGEGPQVTARSPRLDLTIYESKAQFVAAIGQ